MTSSIALALSLLASVAVAAACSPAQAPVAASTTTAGDAGGTVYTCPMHPEITAAAPGRCSKCGMDLAPKK